MFWRRVLILRLGEDEYLIYMKTTRTFPGKWDPDTIPVEQFFASTFVLLEMLTKEVKTQIAGLTMVIDVQGFSFKHIR